MLPKTGLLGKAAMWSIFSKFQVLKPRELFGAAASLSLYILLIVSSSYYCIYQRAVMLLFLYVGMVVVVCTYTAIQWKTSTSVLQSGNRANRTVEAKVRNTQKTMIPVLSREMLQRVENFHDILRVAVAHERWGVWKRYKYRLRVFRPTAFLCTLAVSAMQSVYDGFPASSYAAYRWDAICNDIRTTIAAVIVAH